MSLQNKPTHFFVLFFFFIASISANTRSLPFVLNDTTANDVADTSAIMEQEVMILWTKKNAVGMNFNEVAFVNWNAGGNNSISALFHGNFERNFKKDLMSWRTRASLRYGLNAQEGRELRKTEDEFLVSSTYGYRRDSTSKFSYSAKFNFNTQFTAGYRYPNTTKPISDFMAPGYLFLGIGTEYADPVEDLTIYASPFTHKSTFVFNQRLANDGMFGVEPAVYDQFGVIVKEGEMMRSEFGFLLSSGLRKEIFDNVNIDNQISFYSDYLKDFGNIDVDWQLNVDLVVNEFVKANIGSHLRYDNDVKVKKDTNGDGELETLGARIQFKQMLGVGVVYEF